MSNSKGTRWFMRGAFAPAACAFIVASVMAATASAATLRRGAAPTLQGGDPGTYIVGYYDTNESSSENGTGAGTSYVRLINPTRANGTLCAMIYVFDDDEELGECCGCPVTPNGLLSLGVGCDLTNNWLLNGNDFDSGVIKIISATPNGGASGAAHGGCDPTIAYTATPNLSGTILRTQSTYGFNGGWVTGLTETNMFDEGTADPTEAAYLVSQCASNVSNGSGYGTCDCGSDPGN